VQLAYCTNVVAGSSLAEMRSNVERVFTGVRKLVCPTGILPLGLWLSAQSAAQLAHQPNGAQQFRDWLEARGLSVVTLNGFPYHQFHAGPVKHRVYQPHWADAGRLIFTTQLIDLLPALLPAGSTHASISTLPLGWRESFQAVSGGASHGVAISQLQQVARHCARVEDQTGVRVTVDLEPEPGCALDRASDVVEFFDRAFPTGNGRFDARRYIGVCHDICHAAVMFESQQEVLQIYRQAGIRVGKVQISSAPTCGGAPDELAVLASFSEPRYLHQTCVRTPQGVLFFEDLSAALAQAPEGEWRTHFHVPIHVSRLGALGTTQHEIVECLRTIAAWPLDQQPQLELETYAWDVLPAAGIERMPGSIIPGIAAELRWAAERVAECRA
jgi:sugar phosphate isomerase/epimerase